MDELETNVENRRSMLQRLHAELIGPEPVGKLHEGDFPTKLKNKDFWSFLPRKQQDGEEILGESPARRYASAVLHPHRFDEEKDGESAAIDENEEFLSESLLEDDPGAEIQKPKKNQKKRELVQKVNRRAFQPEPGEDSDLLSSHAVKPCAFGLSVVLMPEKLREPMEVGLASIYRTGSTDDAVVERPCGHYVAREIVVRGDEETEEMSGRRTLWLRKPVLGENREFPTLALNGEDLENSGSKLFPAVDGYPSRLELRWHRRSWPEAPEGHQIFTFTVINSGGTGGSEVAQTLFQAGLRLAVTADALGKYPGALLKGGQEVEPGDYARIAELLYHRRSVYAVGHGCSSDWSNTDQEGRRKVWATFLPAWEIPPVSFEALDVQRRELDLPMRHLAGLENNGSGAPPGKELLEKLLAAYEAWIESLEPDKLPRRFHNTGNELVERCRKALGRMRAGMEILTHDPNASYAFRLANQAMLMSQHRRPASKPRQANNQKEPYRQLDIYGQESFEEEEKEKIGRWRPFQLAFLLMSVPGVVDEDEERNPDRHIVDLIWFPTGGGKTEAYLGLAAFTVFYNRLVGRELNQEKQRNSSTILMRYTLRLLTAQQFQRAVTLFCAMELIRNDSRHEEELRGPSFNVGLWVGSSVSPNKNDEAVRKLKIMRGDIRPDPRKNEEADANPFVLLQCPWCSTRFGRHSGENANECDVDGYLEQGQGNSKKVIYRCPETNCEFGPGHGKIPVIPAVVVDEQIYKTPPSLLISTVDKFAMLAWKPEARRLLGLGSEGNRIGRSPELIIQDELHLITGPLGTMVGHFESAVDFLCRHDGGVPSKIIASTATAANAEEQVRGLYARTDLRVFPPSGLDAGDSFFAREATDRPGRLYVGVLAPEHRSLQTTQRHVYASLLQTGAHIACNAEESRAAIEADPWWTILCYYNSIRELGGGLTLFGADVRDQLNVLKRRHNLSGPQTRQLNADHSVMELTSRIRSDEVSTALGMLSRPIGQFLESRSSERTCWADFRDGQGNWAPVQDACLASNMIEVGVDVDRLSLMVIVGQPKTTSSYIQASSRIGRSKDRPGLVVTLYSNTKPRDRSHFERFRAYHQAIYQWVEPTSVTPFSIPVVERALKAVLVAIARQTHRVNRTPANVTASLSYEDDEGISWASVHEFLEDRCKDVVGNDEEITKNLQRHLGELRSYWSRRMPEIWGVAHGAVPDENNLPLMHPSGNAAPAHWNHVWRVPLSLRAVDSSCEAEITKCYSEQEGD